MVKKYSVNIIKINNNIIGMLGFIPCQMNYFGKTISVAYQVNLMVDSTLRNVGIGPRLLMESEKTADVQIGTSYGAAVKPMYKKLQWREMPVFQRYIKPINWKKTSKLALAKIENKQHTLKKPSTNEYSFQKIYTFGKEINSFWEKIKEKYPLSIERNNTYLNWRYSNHPLFQYHLFIIKKNKKIQSYIIYRIETTPQFNIGKIIDFISYDEAEEITLKKIIEFSEEKKIDLIEFMFTGNFHVKSLKKTGFFNANIKPFSNIPFLFNPIDRNRKKMTFAFKLINKKLFDNRVNNINNWYITRGDGDQDRPNVPPKRK